MKYAEYGLMQDETIIFLYSGGFINAVNDALLKTL